MITRKNATLRALLLASTAAGLPLLIAGPAGAQSACVPAGGPTVFSCGSGPGGTFTYGGPGIDMTVRAGSTVTGGIMISRVVGSPAGPVRFTNAGTVTVPSGTAVTILGEARDRANTVFFRNSGTMGRLSVQVGGTGDLANSGQLAGFLVQTVGDLGFSNTGAVRSSTFTSNLLSAGGLFASSPTATNTTRTTDDAGNRVVTQTTDTTTTNEVVASRLTVMNAAGAELNQFMATIRGLGGLSLDNAGTFNVSSLTGVAGTTYSDSQSRTVLTDIISPSNAFLSTRTVSTIESQGKAVAGDLTILNRAGGQLVGSSLGFQAANGTVSLTNEAGALVGSGSFFPQAVLTAGAVLSTSSVRNDSLIDYSVPGRLTTTTNNSSVVRQAATTGNTVVNNAGRITGGLGMRASGSVSVANTGTVTGLMEATAGFTLSDTERRYNGVNGTTASNSTQVDIERTHHSVGTLSLTNARDARIEDGLSLSITSGTLSVDNAGFMGSLDLYSGHLDSLTSRTNTSDFRSTGSGSASVSGIRQEQSFTAAGGRMSLTNRAGATIGELWVEAVGDLTFDNAGTVAMPATITSGSFGPTLSGTRTYASDFSNTSSGQSFRSQEATTETWNEASIGAAYTLNNSGIFGQVGTSRTGGLDVVGDGSVSINNSGRLLERVVVGANRTRSQGTFSTTRADTTNYGATLADYRSELTTGYSFSRTDETDGGSVLLANSGQIGQTLNFSGPTLTPVGTLTLTGRQVEMRNSGVVTVGFASLLANSTLVTDEAQQSQTLVTRFVNPGNGFFTTRTERVEELRTSLATRQRGSALLENTDRIELGGLTVFGSEASQLRNGGRISGISLSVGGSATDTTTVETTRTTETRLSGATTAFNRVLVAGDYTTRSVASTVSVENRSGGTLAFPTVVVRGVASTLSNAGSLVVSDLLVTGTDTETVRRVANNREVEFNARILGGTAALTNTGTVSAQAGATPTSIRVGGNREARLVNGATGSITGSVNVRALGNDARSANADGVFTAATTVNGGLARVQQDGTLAGTVQVLGFAQSALANSGRITGAVTVGSIRLADYDPRQGDALFANRSSRGGVSSATLALPTAVPAGVTLVGPSGLTSVIGTTQAALLGSAVLTNSGTITGAVGVGAYSTAYLENSGTITGDVTLLANGTRVLNNSGTINGTVTIGAIPAAQSVTATTAPATDTVAAPTDATTDVAASPAETAPAAAVPETAAAPVAAPSASPAAATLPRARLALPGLVSAEAQGLALMADEAHALGVAADEAQPEALAPAGTPVATATATVPALQAPVLLAPAALTAAPSLPTPSASRSATADGLHAVQNTALGTRVISTGSITALVAQGPATDIQLSGANARIGSLSFTGAGSTNTVTLNGAATVDSLTSLTDAAGARLANTSVTWNVAAGATPVAFSGTMSGLTGFTRTGAGTLVLRGRVDATNLDVVAGQLGFAGANAGVTGNFAVRSGGTFMPGVTPGQGTVTLANGQLFATRADDMSVGGSFTLAQGGDYRVYVQPAFSRTASLGANGVPVGSTPFAVDAGARSSLVTVGGNATLGGGMTVMLNPYTLYRDGQTVDVMRVGGTLSTTGLSLGLGVASPVITPILRTRTEGTQTVVGVELDRRSYTTVTSAAANGTAVGTGLDGALVATLGTLASGPSNATAQDMANLLTAFDFGLTAAQAAAVAGDLDAEPYASVGALDFSRAFVEAGADRLDAEAGAASAQGTRYGGWATFTGREDRLGERDGLSGIAGDYRGLAVGLDALTPGGLLLGLMAGRGNTELESRGGLDDGSVGSRHFGAYAAARFGVGEAGAIRLNTQVAISRNDIELTRRLPSLGRTATADTQSDEVTVVGQVAYDAVLTGGKTVLSPFVGVAYRHRSVDGFTESGANAVSLTVAKQKDGRVDSTLGLGARHAFTLGEVTTLTPSVTVAYRFEGDPGATATSRFVGGGADFTSLGVERDDGLDLSLGLSLKVGPSFEAFAGYAGTIAEDQRATRVNAGIRARFSGFAFLERRRRIRGFAHAATRSRGGRRRRGVSPRSGNTPRT